MPTGYGSMLNKCVRVKNQMASSGRPRDERQPLLHGSTDSLQHGDSCDSLAAAKEEAKRQQQAPAAPVSIDINYPDLTMMQKELLDTYNPAENRNLDHPTSNFDTMIHLLKGNIGTGILAMPDAFRNAGIAVGLVGTMLMGVICTHCMHMLVGCAHELCCRSRVPALGFSEVAGTAFETGPEPLRRFSKHVRTLINIFLCITQIGFCCVYFVFVAANLQEVVGYYYVKINIRVYLLILLIPMIVLNLLKNLKYLTPVSFFASLLTVSGLAITFWYMLQDPLPITSVQTWPNLAQLPLYFGTAIYAFEGIGIILPLENNMKHPESFGGWNGVLNTGMVIVTCLYTSVGFFGYMKYGEDVKVGSITLNLPGTLLAQSVRVMMALAIFLSYGLQFYVPMNIIWPFIKQKLETEKSQHIGEIVTRTSLVLFTFVLAALIPNLGAVISLVGAVSSSTLALIFPPIIEIITFWPNNLGMGSWRLWKDICIIMFGLAGFGFGTYVSMANILSPEY